MQKFECLIMRRGMIGNAVILQRHSALDAELMDEERKKKQKRNKYDNKQAYGYAFGKRGRYAIGRPEDYRI